MDERARVDCVANARAVAPLIAAAALRIEANRELPADLVDALHEARLYRMLVPRAYGGEEVSPVDYVQAIEEIAKADASVAWCIGQTSVCSTIAKAMKPEVAAEIFKENPRGVLAWGPTGSGKALVDKGGFRVSGTWPFASGSRQATWLAAHCVVYERNGEPRRDADGKPIQKTLVLPRESAKIDDVWHVIGLKGTGSDTYTFTDAFVPEQYAIGFHALNPAEWHERGPLYLFTIYQLFGASFPAVALGIARSTLDAFCALAQKKTPTGQTVMLRDNPVVQSQVGSCSPRWRPRGPFCSMRWPKFGGRRNRVRSRWTSGYGCAWLASMPLSRRAKWSKTPISRPAPRRCSRAIRLSADSATCMRCRSRPSRSSRSTRPSAGISSACRRIRG